MSDYQRILQSSIFYIEKRLLQDIDLESVAEWSGFSLYHFMRVFSIFTGYTLKGYIRTRRLSEAARELLQKNEYIYKTAQKYGFNSVESFIRAFKRQFGLTPQKYRKRKQLIGFIPELRVEIHPEIQGGFMVKYQIKEMPRLTVIGKKEKIKSRETSQKINLMVEEMRDYLLSNKISDNKTVAGICFHDPRFFDKQPEPDDEWWYMTGWLASEDTDVPHGMEKYHVPAQRYAVFTHKGNLSNLGKTYRYICLDWIRKVDYQFYPADELNFFSEKYNGANSESSEYKLYIPIK